jgi:hypothetical protein
MRMFGESVCASEVIAEMQRAEGVEAVFLEWFDFDLIDNQSEDAASRPALTEEFKRESSPVDRNRGQQPSGISSVMRDNSGLCTFRECDPILKSYLTRVQKGSIFPAELLLLNASRSGIILRDMNI